jgi:hypothetical protein
VWISCEHFFLMAKNIIPIDETNVDAGPLESAEARRLSQELDDIADTSDTDSQPPLRRSELMARPAEADGSEVTRKKATHWPAPQEDVPTDAEALQDSASERTKKIRREPKPRAVEPAMPNCNVEDIRKAVKEAMDKPKSASEQLKGGLETVGKALSLVNKLAGKCNYSCTVVVDVINNLGGITLELVAQSSSKTHDHSCGIFQTAPDPFIGAGSGCAIMTSSRAGNYDNYNGVIYRAEVDSRFFYITVAWAFPSVSLFGKGSRYHLQVSETLGDSLKMLEKAYSEGESGKFDTTVEGEGAGLPIKAVGSFSDPRITVFVRPN